ncbi:hypothetical protein Fcan01_05883 [Folsomia candida]|uniref:Uncharacterized protein n=1 Tax=Folsomia candida TaxID=158441 RepID=A0A226EPQ0_FOLCA|nr:hypothetical protein Fcan01_05883 [Folsomia candida]
MKLFETFVLKIQPFFFTLFFQPINSSSKLSGLVEGRQKGAFVATNNNSNATNKIRNADFFLPLQPLFLLTTSQHRNDSDDDDGDGRRRGGIATPPPPSTNIVITKPFPFWPIQCPRLKPNPAPTNEMISLDKRHICSNSAIQRYATTLQQQRPHPHLFHVAFSTRARGVCDRGESPPSVPASVLPRPLRMMPLGLASRDQPHGDVLPLPSPPPTSTRNVQQLTFARTPFLPLL